MRAYVRVCEWVRGWLRVLPVIALVIVVIVSFPIGNQPWVPLIVLLMGVVQVADPATHRAKVKGQCWLQHGGRLQDETLEIDGTLHIQTSFLFS